MTTHDFKAYPELTNAQLQTMELESPHKQIKEDFRATVVKVHDGDTITVTTDFRDFEFPVRFLDIDSPELSEGGEETREWLKEKILGATVDIHIDPNNRVGKYGRLLGRVFHMGMDIGQEEIYLGLAVPFGRKKEGWVPDSSFFLSEGQWF